MSRNANKLTRQQKRYQPPINWIIILLLLLSTVAATLVLIFRGNEIARCLHPEVFKLLANLVITLGIGGLGALFLNGINASREHREVNRVLLRTNLDNLVDLYNEIKSVRRRLRVQAIRPSYTDPKAYVLREPYNSLLEELNESQLSLETHKRLVERNMALSAKLKQLLKDKLYKAESYLNKIIGEWEDTVNQFNDKLAENRLNNSQFKNLKFFVKDKHAKFIPNFVEPMTEVFSILTEEILK
ncbi:MAG: hypothetical protein AB4368_12125 [Xenococcaceae cyanobacterium]